MTTSPQTDVGDKFALEKDEVSMAQTGVFKRTILAGWQRGTLYLTTRRLIYRPGGLAFGFGAKSWRQEDVQEAMLEDGSIGTFPHGSTLVLQTKDGKQQFGFGGLPGKRQRNKTEGRVNLIHEWAHSSDPGHSGR